MSIQMKKTVPKLLVCAFFIAVIILIFSMFSDSSATLEKDLTETLPYELKTYYIALGEEIEYVFEDIDLTVNKHSTNGNFTVADCTIEMEDENIKKTVFVELSAMKYNTGWQVIDWSELNEAQVVPKFSPDISVIENKVNEYGFENVVETSNVLELEKGLQICTYSVADIYKFVSFTGEIIVTAEFTRSTFNYADEIERYFWSYSSENNTVPVWNVTGEWSLKATGIYGINPEDVQFPYKATITLLSLSGDGTAMGSSVYYYPRVDGYVYLGDYQAVEGGVGCKITGDCPANIILKLYGNESRIEFTCNDCVGYIRGVECFSLVRN